MQSEQQAMEALAALMGKGKRAKNGDASHDEPSHQEMIARLKETYVRYQMEIVHGECPFEPGDLVTPRKDTYINDAGTPYIVLDTHSCEEPLWSDMAAGTMRDGILPNIRVGRWTPIGLVSIWVESWAFEKYDAEKKVV